MRATWVAFGAAAVVGFILGCVVDLPPDGKYTCASDGDCGSGYKCTPASAGPRYCCQATGAEICDGKDNDCNGVVDDVAPAACYDGPSGTLGVGLCHGGTQICVDGGMACQGEVVPTAELCNNADDNCDGTKDEGFDFKTDPNNCGRCGLGCAAPLRCEDGGCSVPIETNCSDGLDNDGDRAIDCADSDCVGQECSAAGGCTCKNFGKTETGCGDGLDNDNDGPIDCLDSDCDGGSCGTGCQCQRGAQVEILCGDGLTNDGDPDIDCLDSDCDGQNCNPDGGGGCTCRGGGKTESACFGGFDEDGDGLIDCLDNDCDGGSCAAVTGCQCRQGGKVEINCTDRVDNDGDNTVDKCDLDCSTTGCGTGCSCDGGFGGTAPGVPAETNCADGLDNDNDGLTDCNDLLDCLNQVCNGSGTRHCNSSRLCR